MRSTFVTSHAHRLRAWPFVVALALIGLALRQVQAERDVRHAVAAMPTPTHVNVEHDKRSLAELCAAAGVAYPPKDVRIVVEKSARQLTLFVGDRPLVRYHVGLGFSTSGNKQREGDGKTPEGELRIVTRNDKSRFHRFLGLSYPRPNDAWAGSVTTDEKHAIDDAFAGGAKPPWDTPLGGAVGIHGNGGDKDWTSGCVAVDDAAIDVLWDAAPMGTKVRILP